MHKKIELHDVFTTNYVEYAKYTITDRAIPALEDGCKNIHRRILWSMHVNKNTYDKNRVKANTSVGLCMGYSPHGNTSIYGAMVRFANDSVNINLIDGKGAFSSKTSRDIDAGADRYVEVRLAPITQEYLKDIDKNIAGMKNNYDDTKLEPIYLPVTFPSILCNPNLGIATGIASNICAFPVENVIDNTIKIIDNEEITLMIPTFSTGGELLYNEKILKQVQDFGTGKLTLRSKYEIKENSIVITEIPYTSTREAIVEKIIDLVKDGKLKSVTDVNDHTGKDGLKITIDTKKNTDMKQLIKFLLKKTPMQDTFSCNFNVLDNGKPKTLGTKDIIIKWLEFRRKCIVNGINYDINNKSEKLHLLLGFEKVLLNIDKAVEIIRHSNNPLDDLITSFTIDKIQSENVLNMKLKNINKDYIIKQIKDIDSLRNEVELLKININNVKYIDGIIKEDLLKVKKLYSYPLKTKIIYEDVFEGINTKDVEIEDYNCRIFYTNNYIKKHLKQSDNHKYKEDNIILGDITSTNKSTLLVFTNKANRFRIPCSDLEQFTPSSYGTYLSSLFKLDSDEEVIKIVSVEKPIGYMIFTFENGKVAKVKIDKFMSAYQKLENSYSTESKLLDIYYTEKDVDILMVSSEGKAIVFNSSDINAVSTKNSQGSVGMKLDGSTIISAIINVNKDVNFELTTLKGKVKEFTLSDIAPTNKKNEDRELYTYLYSKRANQGNFLINTRTNQDEVIELVVKQ